MPVPTFTFTDRVVPVVQMGRFQRAYRGKDRWGLGQWGVAKWGRGPETLYDPVWAEVTCDVHEVTTNIGRNSASDRFKPATASIIASNVTGWGDGEVPVTWPHFYDDFERTGPELDSSWDRWTEMESLRPAMGELAIEEAEEGFARAATVQKYRTGTTGTVTPPLVLRGTYQRQQSSATLTIGPFPGALADDVVWLYLAVDGGIPSPGLSIPDWQRVTQFYSLVPYDVFVYRHRMTAEEAATDQPWIVSCPGRWNYTTLCVGGVGEPEEHWWVGEAGGGAPTSSGTFEVDIEVASGVPFRMPTDGCIVARVMMGQQSVSLGTLPAPLVDIAERCDSPDWDFTQYLAIDGGTASPTTYAVGVTAPTTLTPFAAPPAPPWRVVKYTGALVIIPGTRFTPESLPYEGSSGNRYAVPYIGDHFVETVVSGLRAPERVWPGARFLIELYVHLVTGALTSQVAGFEWVPDWDDPDVTGVLSWWIRRRSADGSWAAAPFASGTRTFGPQGFPELAVLRFEADTDGTLRVMFQGAVLGIGSDPAPATGDHVAIYAEYETGSLSYGRTEQPGPVRFEEVAGGAHAPNPIYLEPGTLIRVGVYHQRFDYRWLFRGYVDALRPIYDPQRDDTVRIECIDALGEAGRLRVPDFQDPRELEATDRVAHILNAAEWPHALRHLDDDATIMGAASEPYSRVIDLLTQTAESCGGAVYGGPGDGCVTFRRKDWQGWDPDKDPVDGFITDRPAETLDFTGLVVCPAGWERSWDRQDMTTRVTYTIADGDEVTVRDSDAERRWGIEAYERTLVTVYPYNVKVLARRQLRLRGPEKFPRVEAAVLDAATSPEALDMMATATFTKPHQYQCQLRRADGTFVFNHRMLVTGLRHVLTPDRWTLRIALDLAGPFIAVGGRWSNPGKPRGRWGVDVWGHAR